MESKLNHSSIETYSEAYANKLASEFYKNQEAISGKQIVALCNVRQVNFLILKNIFEQWKTETEKLKSPYFDYTHKEVAEALNTFMNVLSQNISIKRPQFEPFLKKAVYDTILLIFSPFEYFGKEINNPEKKRISLEELQEFSKYVKVNNHLLEDLIAHFKSRDLKEVYNDEGYRILTDIFEKSKEDKVEDFKEYLDLFSETLPLNIDMVFKIAVAETVAEEIEVIEAKKEEPQQKETAATNFFHQLTLNEKLNASSKSNLADLHQKKKIDNIKKHISIYQRFMFINELFNGKVEEFDKAVETLDVCDNYQEALHVIDQNYLNKYKWNMEAEEVNEFLEILAKRYN